MKTYYSRLCYYNVLTNNVKTIVKLNKKKMKMVKQLIPSAFPMFEYVVKNFERQYSNNIVTYDELKLVSKLNGALQITKPKIIVLKSLNEESFNNWFSELV